MTRGESGPAVPPRLPAGLGEETAEFQLTAEQQAELWKAAAALAPPPNRQSSVPGYDAYICRRTDRVDRVSTIAFATLVLSLTASAGWHAITAAPHATASVAAHVAPEPMAPIGPRAPVVQVTNPFDSTEVFELPANTTESEARDSIAALLLQRARGRIRQGFTVHRVSNRHALATAATPLNVFVTRLSSTESRVGGVAGLNTERAAAD